MSAALRSEWVKAFAGRGARFAYLLLFALTIGFSAFIASGSTTSPRGAFGDNDMIAEGLSGVLTATIVAAVIGVVAIGNEYGVGDDRDHDGGDTAAIADRPRQGCDRVAGDDGRGNGRGLGRLLHRPPAAARRRVRGARLSRSRI